MTIVINIKPNKIFIVNNQVFFLPKIQFYKQAIIIIK